MDPLAKAAGKTGENGLEYELPATTEGVERFIAALHGFLAEEGLARLAFDMELLAREALMNAVQHGSGSDPGMTVGVRLNRVPGALSLCVRDQGPGFDWRRAAADSPDPMAEKVTCPPKPGPGIMLEFLTKEDGIWPGKDEHQNRL